MKNRRNPSASCCVLHFLTHKPVFLSLYPSLPCKKQTGGGMIQKRSFWPKLWLKYVHQCPAVTIILWLNQSRRFFFILDFLRSICWIVSIHTHNHTQSTKSFEDSKFSVHEWQYTYNRSNPFKFMATYILISIHRLKAPQISIEFFL